MAAPAMPQNFTCQQGNAQVLLTWSAVSGAVSYSIQRGLDGINWTTTYTSTLPQYLDTAVTVGTQYYYRVQASDGTLGGVYTSVLSAIPTNTGDLSLAQIRQMAKQRADMENSSFISDSEWNTYINQSSFELYDLLVTEYEDYFVQSPYSITTDGVNAQFSLPSDFYKVMGVDGPSFGSNGYVSLKRFNFIDRNRGRAYPGVRDIISLRYAIVGNTILFDTIPQANIPIRIWYVPKLTQLLKDTDIMSGISGWTEYVIVDAAIKAMQKEESDVSVLAAQKMMLIKRIEESAMNRDEGQFATISDTRRATDFNGFSERDDGSFY